MRSPEGEQRFEVVPRGKRDGYGHEGGGWGGE